MILVLSDSIRERLFAHAGLSHPRECCGFLLGRMVDGVYQACDVLPVENAAEGTDRYVMAPESVLMANQAAQDRNLDLIAAYHSHPEGEAFPSQTDRREAVPGMFYLILSARNMRAWRMSESGSFESTTLMTSLHV